ncbi:hypothetical protein [Novilysobacter defluvii]|nr:hypothetical protein [Lysobacter defluvii]
MARIGRLWAVPAAVAALLLGGMGEAQGLGAKLGCPISAVYPVES